ncbi:MAG: hypothetical protein JWL64_1539, partial [Frankiales bacterium]|nr:hypothetical protein [Frankiales bacterium]
VDHPMSQHGFARDREFTVVEQGADHVRLRLDDDDATRSLFPYAFRLELRYRVSGTTLTVDYLLTNPADRLLRASLGAHPAFAWPLPGATGKAGHLLTFGAAEPEPIRRLADGLLAADLQPSPVRGRVLALTEDLFAADALVFDRLRSDSVVYSGPGAAMSLAVSWRGFPHLGLWSRPGADFLCIEPWHGYASPVGLPPDLEVKPGLMTLQPGATRQLTVTVEVRTGPAPD